MSFRENSKAFTLIELLVVVAIIGILAAVGVVAYNGYTGAAKASAAKSNHKTVINYMAAEIAKCELGELTVMDGNLTCSGRTRQSVIDATVNALSEIKNPYGEMDQNLSASIRMNAVTDGGTYSSGGSGGGLGYVRLQDHSAKVLRIGTCYKPIEIPNNDYTCYLNKTNYTYFENDIQVIE